MYVDVEVGTGAYAEVGAGADAGVKTGLGAGGAGAEMNAETNACVYLINQNEK